jgi:hypothetical protein
MNPRYLLLFALLTAGRAGAADVVTPAAAPAVKAPPTAKPAVAAALGAPGAATNSGLAPTASFDAFRTIGDYNIFNPNRTGRRVRTEEVAPKLDTISLVGTMDYEKGVFAFFDGSDASYRKATRVGESVGPFKVTQISGNGVQVERDGKSLPMHVSDQFRRPDGGDWTLVAGAVAQAQASAAAAARTPDPTAAPTIPADASDVLRRMMEQRQKQLKQ